MEINRQIIAYNFSVRSGGANSVKYIVIHDTSDPGATAQNEHDYFAGGDRHASADYFVDSGGVMQIIDSPKYYSWHCGDGAGKYGITNANSVGIELCIDKAGKIC